mmetsp:Transcript_6270/g.10081  ORF Transcript_6270/g.10081 Transcript_6270/m.10081 type:complete len:243 (-) Transcript_6270:271-999(-)
MSFSYVNENCMETLPPGRNAPSSGSEGNAFTDAPPRWNVLINTSQKDDYGMSSPKKERSGPYTPMKTSRNDLDEEQIHNEGVERKSPSLRVVLTSLTQGAQSGTGNQMLADREHRIKDKADDCSSEHLRIPVSWSTSAHDLRGSDDGSTSANEMEGSLSDYVLKGSISDDVLSVSSGDAMASVSPDQSHTPPSKDMREDEDEESPTDAFIRRMHEDEAFGQSRNSSGSCEGHSRRSDANAVH